MASTAGVLGLQLGLFTLYVGTFVRIASSREPSQCRPVDVFAALQTVAAVAVGFVGALAVARPLAAGVVVALGAAGWILAAASQAAAAWAVRRAPADHVLYFGGLATLLLFAASGVLLPRPAVLWAVLAILIAALAGRWRRLAFRLQAAVIAVAAIAGPGPWIRRFDTALLALTVVVGGGVVVILAVPLVAGSPADPAIVATVRTAVLAASALGLAMAAKTRLRTAPLVYPSLLVGAVKLMIEDFPAGNPSTLFLSLAFFGSALILAPRRLRAAEGGSEDSTG
ncbi:MAG: hypothetical protein V3T72_20780 [Thermoanaerobaculia bacterium]